MTEKSLLIVAMTREPPGYHQGALLQGHMPMSAKRRHDLIMRRRKAVEQLHAISGELMNNGKAKTKLQIRRSSTNGSDAPEDTAKCSTVIRVVS